MGRWRLAGLAGLAATDGFSRCAHRQAHPGGAVGKSMQFGDGLAPAAWSLRAVVTGVVLITVGALVGGVFGMVFGAETGGIAALCLVAVGGIFWALSRIGATGIGLGMIGGIAALLGAAEIRHAVVVNGPITTLPSLAAWDPHSGASVLLFAPVEGEPRYRALNTKTHGGGKGRGVTTIHYSVTPLKERDRVVGYACSNSLRRGHSGVSGGYALAAQAWDGTFEQACREGIRASEHWVRAAGIDVAPGSSGRVVRVYASEAALRADHEAAQAFWGPGIFLGIYLAGVIAYRFVISRKKRSASGGAA